MRKSLLLLLLAAVLALGIAAVAYVAFALPKSPHYALAQVYNAVLTHDLAKFQKYVDVRGVLSLGVDTVVAHAMGAGKSPPGKADGWSALGDAVRKGLLGLVKDPLVDMGERETARLIESDTLSAGFRDAASPRPPWVDGLLLRFLDAVWLLVQKNPSHAPPIALESLRYDGKLAFVTVRVRNRKLRDPLPLELRLRELDGYWQVAEVLNAPDLLDRLDLGDLLREKLESPEQLRL